MIREGTPAWPLVATWVMNNKAFADIVQSRVPTWAPTATWTMDINKGL